LPITRKLKEEKKNRISLYPQQYQKKMILEKLVDRFAEAIQSACRRTFKTTSI
jgi:hypothetical protein